jgi:hypothetical protein
MGFRKRSAPILAVSLAFLLVPGSAYAAAAAPVDSNAGQAITQAESASPATVVVASGAATTTSGSAVRDAVIDLYAWPSDKVLQALTFGQEVPRTLVATATADSAGKFSLSLPRDTLSAQAASSGFVNLEADSGTATWFFPTDAAKPAATTIRLTGASTKHVTDSFTYSRGSPPRWASASRPRARRAPSRPTARCPRHPRRLRGSPPRALATRCS